MVTGKTITDVSESMYKKTINQAKKLNKQLPSNIDKVYAKSVKDYDKISEKNKKPEDKNFKEYIKFADEYKKFEYKRNNRWLLEFPKELNISELSVSSMTRPSYPFFENNSIVIVLHDLIEPSITESLLPLISKNDGISTKKFKLNLLLLDPTGVAVEKWTLKDCTIKKIEWSLLDYSDDSPSLVHLEVSYNDLKFKKV